MSSFTTAVGAAVLAAFSVSLQGCGSDHPSSFSDHESVELSNGVRMPLMSAGTWLYDNDTAEAAVTAAISAGFKHIDTAHDYGNQVGVGKGLLASGVKRADIFVTTKVPGCGMQGLGKDDCYNNTGKLVMEDLALLGEKGFDIKYLDLILIHFPPCMSANGTEKKPFDTPCGKARNSCTAPGSCKAIRDQWNALEDLYKSSIVKAIGVSNYCSACFDCLKDAKVKPMVNQVQMHVGMGPDPQGFVAYAKANNITLQAWSPLGAGGSGNPEIISGNLTTGIGKAHGKSSVQVALKWLLSHGVAVATKSSNPTHLAEDIDMFDWSLSEDEKQSLDKADFAAKDTPSFMCDDKGRAPEEDSMMFL